MYRKPFLDQTGDKTRATAQAMIPAELTNDATVMETLTDLYGDKVQKTVAVAKGIADRMPENGRKFVRDA